MKITFAHFANITAPLFRPFWLAQLIYLVIIGILLFRFNGDIVNMKAIDERDITGQFSPLSTWILAVALLIANATAAVISRRSKRPLSLIFATINALMLVFLSYIWYDAIGEYIRLTRI